MLVTAGASYCGGGARDVGAEPQCTKRGMCSDPKQHHEVHCCSDTDLPGWLKSNGAFPWIVKEEDERERAGRERYSGARMTNAVFFWFYSQKKKKKKKKTWEGWQ